MIMQSRRAARELALLGISQLPAQAPQLNEPSLSELMAAVIRILMQEVNDTLEAAAAELKRGRSQLLDSETRTVDVQAARKLLTETIDLTEAAINKIGMAIEFPELLHLSNQQEVREYAFKVIKAVQDHRETIDQALVQSLVDWNLDRLARIDRDILRIAIAEIRYLTIPTQVAINEAVELAKRYSSDEGHRFINGVLRRVTDRMNKSANQPELQ